MSEHRETTSPSREPDLSCPKKADRTAFDYWEAEDIIRMNYASYTPVTYNLIYVDAGKYGEYITCSPSVYIESIASNQDHPQHAYVLAWIAEEALLGEE